LSGSVVLAHGLDLERDLDLVLDQHAEISDFVSG